MKIQRHDPGCDCVYCWRSFSRQVSVAYHRIEDRSVPAGRRRRAAHRVAFRFGRGLLAPWPPLDGASQEARPRRSRRAS